MTLIIIFVFLELEFLYLDSLFAVIVDSLLCWIIHLFVAGKIFVKSFFSKSSMNFFVS